METEARSARSRGRSSGEGSKQPAYSAPALEKGLDVLELLASVPEGLTQSAIAQHLGRSIQEVYRMVVSLERRGYIVRRPPGDAFWLSMKLHKLALAYPPLRRLRMAAEPIMQRLSFEAHQAFLLSVLDGVSIWAIAQVDSPEPVGLRVRLGTAASAARTASGRVLLAFQEPEVQHWIFDAMSKSLDAKTFQRLKARVDQIHRRGYELITDETIRGVTDVGMPVLDRKGTALAALTMPFLETASNTISRDAAAELLAAAAEELSAAMGGEMRRPALPLIPF